MKTQDIKELDVEMATELVRLQKENEVLKIALYWACNYITRIVDKDVNKLSHEWADYFIQQAKESIEK